MAAEYCKNWNFIHKANVVYRDNFVKTKNYIMENLQGTPERNENVEGYKIPGDGNAPNSLPQPGNKSFEENPHAAEHKNKDDIPGKEFNIGDKAFFDSSKEDFVKTVSMYHHASPEQERRSADPLNKKPDGDR